jgi:hypothetical protein
MITWLAASLSFGEDGLGDRQRGGRIREADLDHDPRLLGGKELTENVTVAVGKGHTAEVNVEA